ncbi:MAG: glycine dehydrogenase, partial [Flavobacteriales bacterium]
MKIGSFVSRHVGPRLEDQNSMLRTLGALSLNELIERVVPGGIRLRERLDVTTALTESEYLEHIDGLASQNTLFRNYIGMGYYPTEVPSVIRRNVLENPGWYTAYTPYQAEIAQGRLEALLNFQTMVMDLTGMEVANASLLDEGTSAAEAMAMLFAARPRPQVKEGRTRFLVDDAVFPQTLSVLRTRAAHLDINLELMARDDMQEEAEQGGVFGCLVQYPDANGEAHDLTDLMAGLAALDVRSVFATDLMALLVMKSPGQMGADVVVGSTQRFGVPMGYGGPHAAFFAAKESFKRHFPGRIIGVSIDRLGKQALRMALQTREQHIRRDKATSNICTAQSLLAVMASMYAVYHGPQGLRAISERIHAYARTLAISLGANESLSVVNTCYFDTLKVHVAGGQDAMKALRARAEAKRVNLRYYPDGEHVGISLHERINRNDFATLCS